MSVRSYLTIAFLLSVKLLTPADAASLAGVTSKPDYSVFVRGEEARLTFTVEGLKPNETGLTVTVIVADVDGQVLMKKELPIAADSKGKWRGTVTSPSDRLGYYHVTARLSSGEELPAVGSRAAGFLSYMVVIDPKGRVQPGEDAHFGMQGGFTTAFDARPYLGIHWVLGGYGWGREEPDHPGQFAQTRIKLREHPDLKEQANRESERALGILPLPTLLVGTPKWAVTDGKLVYTTGVLKELGAWRDYCCEVGRAAREDYPYLKRHVFQITWEPVYPWGFPGTDEDLIRSYQVAYPALHETDPSAFVIGPTGAGISAGDLEWNERLLKKGLGKYLDGFSIHPYIGQPPEKHNLIQNIRALKEMIRTYVGRDLDLYGTEQGWPTGADQAKELPQATWLTRSYLVMLGEGFKVNFAFYFADYPGEPGYGFFHNLNMEKIPWGTNSVSPKPEAAAFAAMTMLLEGHKSVGAIEWLGPTAHGYAYQRIGRASFQPSQSGEERKAQQELARPKGGSPPDLEVTLALWDYGDTPRSVKLPVGVGSVELFDWMGNGHTTSTPGGMLSITLGSTPQYVRGISPALWGAGARRPLVIDPPNLVVFPGDKLRMTARVSVSSDAPLTATLRIEPPDVLEAPVTHKQVKVRAGEQASAQIEVIVPTDSDFGAFPLRATLERNGETVGFATAMVRIKEPLSVEQVRPTGASSLSISIRNHKNAAARGMARVRLRGAPDTRREVAFALKPSGTAFLSVDFSGVDLEPTRAYRVAVTLADASGATVSGEYPASFLTAPRVAQPPKIGGDLSDWRNVPSISLKGREHVVRQPQLYRGAEDLSAKLWYAWDDDALYLAADVTDAVFVQEREGFNTWHDDCLQLAFDTNPHKVVTSVGNVLAEGAQRTNSEIDLALTKNGPEAYRTLSPNEAKLPVGLIDRKKLKLAVTKRPGGLIYEAAIPWTTLGAAKPPQPNSVLGVALTVNDSDDPKQLDPKAIGLFGGITPMKDPTQFGLMVLSDKTALLPPRGRTTSSLKAPKAGGALRFHGFLGQSESPDALPVPWTNCVGAMTDAKGNLWTISGDRAYCFTHARLQKSIALPEGMRAMRGDGRRMLCLGWSEKFYSFDVETEKITTLGDARFADGKGPRDIALGPKGDFCALGYDGSVRSWSANGTPNGELLRLTPGKDWGYCSLGIDPANGDLLVGSYWPDNKLYRFDRSGKPKAVEELENGYAVVLTTLEGQAWTVNVGGKASPLTKSKTRQRALSGEWAYYPTGLASDPEGGAWVACAQGLLHFDQRGRPTGRRIGAMGDPGIIAVGSDGSVLTLLENGQRFARLSADDVPSAPLASNANEPWRVGNGWTGRAVGMGWDGDGYLVLDATAKCLWRFDPDHTAWAEKPWTRLTKEGVLKNPRALAVGDAQAFVLDGDSLLAVSITNPEQPFNSVKSNPDPIGTIRSGLLSSLSPTDIVALAADEDSQLFSATSRQVIATDNQGQERWRSDESFSGIVALAKCNGSLFVADRAGKKVVVLDAGSGRRVTSLDANNVPGGLEPTGIAARGTWVFVSDAAGRRVVRLRFESKTRTIRSCATHTAALQPG